MDQWGQVLGDKLTSLSNISWVYLMDCLLPLNTLWSPWTLGRNDLIFPPIRSFNRKLLCIENERKLGRMDTVKGVYLGPFAYYSVVWDVMILFWLSVQACAADEEWFTEWAETWENRRRYWMFQSFFILLRALDEIRQYLLAQCTISYNWWALI